MAKTLARLKAGEEIAEDPEGLLGKAVLEKRRESDR
jgi:hypothetical protein